MRGLADVWKTVRMVARYSTPKAPRAARCAVTRFLVDSENVLVPNGETITCGIFLVAATVLSLRVVASEPVREQDEPTLSVEADAQYRLG